MFRPLLPLLALALLVPASGAQTVTVRVTGTVSAAAAPSGPYAVVSVGDAATWEGTFLLPAASGTPGQIEFYDGLAGTYQSTVGSVVDTSSPSQLRVQDGSPAIDGFSTTNHVLASGGTQTWGVQDSTTTAITGTDLALLGGTYPAGAWDSGLWDVTPAAGGFVTVVIDQVEVLTGCGTTASATLRNDAAGQNPVNFTATPPVAGGSMTLTVTTGLAGTGVVGYRLPLEAPTAFGTVLVDLGLTELLNLPPTLGASGTYQVPVPSDPALCGYSFSAQAYGFSPGVLELYNAYDLALGI